MIYYLKFKYWKIKAWIKAYLNYIKVYLISEVEKLSFFTPYIAFVKLKIRNLADFSLFLLTLSTTLLLSIPIDSKLSAS